jgi:excinuclease ABC subunit C
LYFGVEARRPYPGDDYAMMREVLRRRFGRLVKEDAERQTASWPDLVVIDGGAGQLAAAVEVLSDLDLPDLAVMAVAKGPDRDAGRERFFVPGCQPFMLQPRDPVLYFVQRLRDEAHRFAIGTHRNRRSRGIGRSELDRVPGIGGSRKKALLQHFGSARGVAQAGLRDLEQVPGISKTVARAIYDHFHDSH